VSNKPHHLRTVPIPVLNDPSLTPHPMSHFDVPHNHHHKYIRRHSTSFETCMNPKCSRCVDSPPPSYHALHIHTSCTSGWSPNPKVWNITHGTKWHSTGFKTCMNPNCSQRVDSPSPPPTMPFASTRRVHLGGDLIPGVGTSCMEPNAILRVSKHA
jgi:hypothetical protein